MASHKTPNASKVAFIRQDGVHPIYQIAAKVRVVGHAKLSEDAWSNPHGVLNVKIRFCLAGACSLIPNRSVHLPMLWLVEVCLCPFSVPREEENGYSTFSPDHLKDCENALHTYN